MECEDMAVIAEEANQIVSTYLHLQIPVCLSITYTHK